MKGKKIFLRAALAFTLILITSISLQNATKASAQENWLPGWADRVELILDQEKIDSNLSNFPVLINLSSSSGINSSNMSFVFDLLEKEENRQKLAFTGSDGISQLYAEIETWDQEAKMAEIWVNVPNLSEKENTRLYLYFDKNQPNNAEYVGDTGSAAAEKVWNENFKTVQHLGKNEQGAYQDSTKNKHTGLAKGARHPETSSGKIGNSQLFSSGYIEFADHDDFSVSTTGQLTVSFWLSPAERNMSATDYTHYIGKGTEGNFEWAFRIYNANYSDRPQSLSLYHWNHSGDLGAGSRWDHSIIPNNSWVFVTGRFGRINGSSDISIFGNGKKADSDSYSSYNIKPKNGAGPLRLGTRDAGPDWLKGRLDEFRISSVASTDAWIKASFHSESDNLVIFGSQEKPVP